MANHQTSGTNRNKAAVHVAVRCVDPLTIPARDIAAWQSLEARAIEPNAYHAPQFLLPLLRHLESARDVQIVLVERHAAGVTELIGAAALRPRHASALLPAPHLAAYTHLYSPQASVLIDAEHAHEALLALDAHARRTQALSAGLVLLAIDLDGPLARVWQEVSQGLGIRHHAVAGRQRALLRVQAAGEEYLRMHLRKKNNEVERCRRRLSELGTVEWQMHRGPLPPDSVDAFLRLEQASWKGEAGSALLSCPRRTAFFKEMVAGFEALGRAMFTEVRLDGRVIASSCNLLSGDAGFAFKVAFDPAHRKFGPGVLNEMDLIRHAPRLCSDLRFIDSGATADSFINELWLDRRTIGTVVCVRPGLGRLAWRFGDAVRHIRKGRPVSRIFSPA